jgi:hypothetical protein
MGDEFDDMATDQIVQDVWGYCYTPDELYQTLTNSKRNENPFTRQPLWKDRTGFNQLFSHRGFTTEQRARLVSIFYPAFDRVIIDLVRSYPAMFDLIGLTGAVLLSDYTEGFKPSGSMLAELNREMTNLPTHVKEQFMSLMTPDGIMTLRQVIDSSNTTCIHGIGGWILNIYLFVWYHIPVDQRPPLIDPLYQTSIDTAVVMGIFNIDHLNVYLFKYDETDIGRIINVNYIAYDMRTGKWAHLNGYPMAASILSPEMLEVLTDDIAHHVDDLMIKHAMLRSWLAGKGFDEL